MFRVLFLFVVLTLTGCATNSISIPGMSSSTSSQLNFEDLYLRGVFNWWEATDRFKFQSHSDGWFVDVELIADGQPYDFRLSNSLWEPEQTCGAKFVGQTVFVSKPVFLVCNPGQHNIQFIPSKTATYRFYITKASAGEVSLTISALN